MATQIRHQSTVPPGPSKLGPMSAIFRDLQLLWHAGAPRYDAVRGDIGTYNSSGYTKGYSAQGEGLRLGNSAFGISWPNRQTTLPTKYTFFGVIETATATAGQVVIMPGGGNQAVTLTVTSAGTGLALTTAGISTFSTLVIPVGEPIAFVSALDEGTNEFYQIARSLITGKIYRTTGTTANNASIAPDGFQMVGSFRSGSSVSFNGKLHMAGMAFSFTPEQLIYGFLADPFQVFEPTLDIKAAAATGNYTLSAAVGSFALSGIDAAIKAARQLAAGVGAFTLSGIAASLLAQRKLTADVGVYTLTGNVTNLLSQRKLTADAGAFVLTGQDASLVYAPSGGYTLAADPGAFVLTGNATGLLAARKITVTNGSFTLSGQTASLLFGRKISAETGVFALTGNAAALAAARKLVAGTGVYTFTGIAANLVSSNSPTYSKNDPLLIDSIGGKVLWLGLPRMSTWNTSGRPSSPKAGTVGFNTQTSAIEVYTGTAWKSVTLT